MTLKNVWIAALLWSNSTRCLWSILFIDSDHTSASKAKVVLNTDLGSVNLALLSHASELPAELSALGHACGSKWVALGDQATAWIHDASAAVGELIAIDSLAGLALWAEAERLIRDELVSAEAVVQLYDVDVGGCDPCLTIGVVGCVASHGPANQIKARSCERVWFVSLQADAANLNCLVLKSMLLYESL